MTLQSDYDALLKYIEPYQKTDPLAYLKAAVLANKITSPDWRFVRAETLQTLAAKLHETVTLCDFPGEIVIRRDGAFVDVGGVLMESSLNATNFKLTGAPFRSQGEHLTKTLAAHHIAVSTAVDIGANHGDISLCLTRAYPSARIIAVEPSSESLRILTINKNAQRFPTDRIEIVPFAISDTSGSVNITRGGGPMNRVIEAAGGFDVESVDSETMVGLFDKFAIGTADFVKIDIEGGEPKLQSAIVALGPRVGAYHIEFSQFAPFEKYIELAATLLAQRFKCFDFDGVTALSSLEDIASHLRKTFALGRIQVANLWFFADAP